MKTTPPILLLLVACFAPAALDATPANKIAFEKHYDRFLSRSLARCTTCHLPSEAKNPEKLADFPHNLFGDHLRQLGESLAAEGRKADLPTRLALVAGEDADGDGVPNETELLLGHNPGNRLDQLTAEELASATDRRAEFAKFLSSYRWQPFETVQRPLVPSGTAVSFTARNPIDAFLETERAARGLTPRPEASREVLLRRVYLDLIGLAPTPAEQRAFLDDPRSDAYERLVDRLLIDPRHGERWGRHWMDVWRYSDWAGWTDGGQIRDSQRHIWRWRDWIVESLNDDKPYDQMLREMLAADELAPLDTNTLRATGFLVRNYKMLSREQWLEDTLKHTAQAFLGLTVGCAKCHDHLFDPVTQREYYALRAIFEPHQVRTDKLPGTTNTALDGLARAYDSSTNPPTWLYLRGDERTPDTNRVIPPGVPASLGGALRPELVKLPRLAAHPDEREHVRADTLAASAKSLAEARRQRTAATNAIQWLALDLQVEAAHARHEALLAVIAAERVGNEESPGAASTRFAAATNAVAAQRRLALAEVRLKAFTVKTNLFAVQNKSTNELAAAEKKSAEAGAELARAEVALAAPLGTNFTRRPQESYPAVSSGRRLAFACWLTDARNPLTARVAVNHVWLRHFGRGLAANPADFGRDSRPPTHPQLLDWLAAEFMAHGWSLRELHRLMVTSAAYRMASTPDETDLARDPDNVWLWRMNSRRLEAEAVRDNLLWCAGSLDLKRGGPELDHTLALTTHRRSLYLRQAAEKQPEFLQIFDGPAVTECYERRPSVMPQQALALANSELAFAQARALAKQLADESAGDPDRFVDLAFARLLAREPTAEERALCRKFLVEPAAARIVPADGKASLRPQENLVLVLFNHNDFVTVR